MADTVHIFVNNAVEPRGLERLRSMPRVSVAWNDDNTEPEQWLLPEEHLAAQIVFTTYAPANLDAARAMKFMQISSVGYEHLNGARLVKRGICICNAAGVFDVPMAEWNIGMMVALARDLRGMIRHQDAGVWDNSARFQGELCGRTVGFWGYGGVARATARLCKAMGMTVHALTRSGSVRPRENIYCVAGHGDPEGSLPDRVFTLDQKQQFLAALDFLVITAPLTASTRGIVGEQELRQLPTRAYVLNPSRGPIIEEQALLRALREGWIAGAALDTHYHYPMPADHPLWRFPNVIMTPHISGSVHSPGFRPRLWEIFIENVERFMASGPLLNELSAQQLRGD